LAYQQILNQLTLRRTENAAQDAVNARTFFGGNLNHPDANGAFEYFKRGQTHILSKDDAIAKKWKGLLERHSEYSRQHSERPSRREAILLVLKLANSHEVYYLTCV
jgi:hypothetical protein